MEHGTDSRTGGTESSDADSSEDPCGDDTVIDSLSKLAVLGTLEMLLHLLFPDRQMRE